MKFLIDAHLPYSLKAVFESKGQDVLHTRDLPNQNFSTDNELRQVALQEDRVIISKDSDFYDSHILQNNPKKLILVKTGNCTRKEIIEIFENRIDELLEALENENLIIITKN